MTSLTSVGIGSQPKNAKISSVLTFGSSNILRTESFSSSTDISASVRAAFAILLTVHYLSDSGILATIRVVPNDHAEYSESTKFA